MFLVLSATAEYGVMAQQNPAGAGQTPATAAPASPAPSQPSAAQTGTAATPAPTPAKTPYLLDQWWSAAVAIFFLVVVLAITLFVGKKDGMNFFQSPDGAVSVSKVQVWMWTMAIIFAYVYLSLCQGPPGTGVANKADFPNSLWELMGISALSTGTARYIVAVTGKADQPTSQAVKDKIKKQNWVVSMLSDDGQPSMMRLQLFSWTLVTIFLFLIVLYREQKLWDVPQTLVILMGISHAGYLGDKGAAASASTNAQPAPGQGNPPVAPGPAKP
ncbi:MAG TPA: hypothetical protein VE263_07575 [Candidatus Angelobacter sp.]|nr:hypothetical protein [Candidatus Angelobacter sp.]